MVPIPEQGSGENPADEISPEYRLAPRIPADFSQCITTGQKFYLSQLCHRARQVSHHWKWRSNQVDREKGPFTFINRIFPPFAPNSTIINRCGASSWLLVSFVPTHCDKLAVTNESPCVLTLLGNRGTDRHERLPAKWTSCNRSFQTMTSFCRCWTHTSGSYSRFAGSTAGLGTIAMTCCRRSRAGCGPRSTSMTVADRSQLGCFASR